MECVQKSQKLYLCAKLWRWPQWSDAGLIFWLRELVVCKTETDCVNQIFSPQVQIVLIAHARYGTYGCANMYFWNCVWLRSLPLFRFRFNCPDLLFKCNQDQCCKYTKKEREREMYFSQTVTADDRNVIACLITQEWKKWDGRVKKKDTLLRFG